MKYYKAEYVWPPMCGPKACGIAANDIFHEFIQGQAKHQDKLVHTSPPVYTPLYLDISHVVFFLLYVIFDVCTCRNWAWHKDPAFSILCPTLYFIKGWDKYCHQSYPLAFFQSVSTLYTLMALYMEEPVTYNKDT